MKKITSLLMMFMLFVGIGWAHANDADASNHSIRMFEQQTHPDFKNIPSVNSMNGEGTKPSNLQEDPSATCDQIKQSVVKSADDNSVDIKAEVESALAKTGLGFPKDDAPSRAALVAAYENYTSAPSTTTYDQLSAALFTFKTDENINLPIPGKPYIIKMAAKDGTIFTLGRVPEEYESGIDGSFNGGYPYDVFVCQKSHVTTVDKKILDCYVFVNNDGKFLSAQNLIRNNTGKDQLIGGLVYYDPRKPETKKDWCFIVQKMKKYQNNGKPDDAVNPELFGYITFSCLRVYSDFNNPVERLFYVTTDNRGMLGMVSWVCYDDQDPQFSEFVAMSSAFKLVETVYPNHPELNHITGDLVAIPGATAIGTFSAPFATQPPAGVTAYCVTKKDEQNGVAHLTKVSDMYSDNEAGVIPANTGVILTGTTAGEVIMEPALTTPTPKDGYTNLLRHTAGKEVSLAQDAAYLLDKVGNNVGLFLNNAVLLGANKAYLPATATSGHAIKLVVGDETTGIEAAAAEFDNAPIYDLSGRRVLSTVKGGLYIQGGKKFVVK